MLATLFLAIALGAPQDEAAIKAANEIAAKAAAKEATDALKTFQKEYRDRSPSNRSTAVAKLSQTQHKKTIGLIASLLFGRENPAVKMAAAKGLGEFHDLKPYAIQYLNKGLFANKKNESVRAAIYAALGKLGDSACLAIIIKGFRDPHETAAGAAILAAGQVREKQSIISLVGNLKRIEGLKPKEQKKEKNDGGDTGDFRIRGIPRAGRGGGNDKGVNSAKAIKGLIKKTIIALQALTGDKWGSSEEWQIWYARRGKNFKFD